MTNRWPPQPGDLVKVERSTLDPVPETQEMVGGVYHVDEVRAAGFVNLGIWQFNLSDLSPAEPPQTIEQFGRTYRLDEGWQPIETAPSGNEMFLVWLPEHATAMVFKGSILANMRRSDTPKHLKAHGTHWMPLPAPPATKEPTP